MGSKVGILQNHASGRKTVASVVLIYDGGIDSGKVAAVGSVAGAVLNGEFRSLHVDIGAVHITTVGAVNQEFAVARHIDGGFSGFIQLDTLPGSPLRAHGKNLEGGAVGYIEHGTFVHVNGVSCFGGGAVKGEGEGGAVGHIQGGGQGQHQPGGAAVGHPQHLHAGAVKGQHPGGIPQTKAHPAFPVGSQLLFNENSAGARKGQAFIEADVEGAVGQQFDCGVFGSLLHRFVQGGVESFSHLCHIGIFLARTGSQSPCTEQAK